MTLYYCTNCDAQFPKWMGQCPECQQWGTLVQGEQEEKRSQKTANVPVADVVDLAAVSQKEIMRIVTGVSEFDRVLGGGIVPGSLVLIGGDPGIGKSTLMLQIARRLASRVIYISGEESSEQVALRLQRLTGAPASIPFVAQDRCDVVVKTLTEKKPDVAIVDSIQTLRDPDVPSEAGSVSQIRACTSRLLECAKENRIAILLVGHVTKEGALGGPKTLEHLVDCVVYFEGDQQQMYRLLRPVKNRFGSTAEIGVFDMTDGGLVEVKNPSALFLQSKSTPGIAGTIPTVTMEGSRAFFVDVQALVSRASLGYLVRAAVGFEAKRLQLLVAVLQKRAGLNLGTEDVHVNMAGGFSAREPSFDLAVCLAIASSFHDRVPSVPTVAMGEVGLSGEVRMISRLTERIAAARKMGFQRIIVPTQKKMKTEKDLSPVSLVQDALELL